MNTQKKVYSVDPANPYAPPISGMFHNQVPMDSGIPGVYSIYIPENYEFCSPSVMIFTPDDTSAQSFLEDTYGRNWIDFADALGIVLIVVEPYMAETWNLNNAVNMRDDDSFLRNISDTIREFSLTIPAVYAMDERAFYLVGYNQGGSAAHKMAMLWPQLICGLASINGGTVPEEVIERYSTKRSFPFLMSKTSDAMETLSLPNGEIPVPVWMIASSDTQVNSEAVKNHWITAAQAIKSAANEYAQEVYENGTSRIWVTIGDIISIETIFNEFFNQVRRFSSEPGGVLRWAVKPVNENGKGFFFTETEVNGLIRRWLTYVPVSYNGSRSVPLVVGLHGGSNQGIHFAEDSRWHELAEDYGFLVVYPTAYPASAGDTIPVPLWNQYLVLPDGHPADDIAFIKDIIARTKQNYNIDTGRIFVSGHSNGGGMTWRLGIEAPELFAGISPAGVALGSWGAGDSSEPIPLDNPLPVWFCMGQYDWFEADMFIPMNPNDLMLKFWSKYNNFNPNTLITSYDESERNYIRTWTYGTGKFPIFNYMTMHHNTHVHRPNAIDVVWREFFSKLSLGEDGKRYYDGREISKGFVDYVRYEETDRFRYSVDWSTHGADTQNFHSNRRVMETRKDGATFEFAFDGTAFRVISYKGVSQNTFDVYIDEEFIANVDTYNPGFIFKAVVYENDQLTRGVHKVRLVSHTMDSDTRYRVSIDAIDIKGRMLNIWDL